MHVLSMTTIMILSWNKSSSHVLTYFTKFHSTNFNAEPPSKFIMFTPSVEIWRPIADEPRVQGRCDYGGGKREQIAKDGEWRGDSTYNRWEWWRKNMWTLNQFHHSHLLHLHFLLYHICFLFHLSQVCLGKTFWHVALILWKMIELVAMIKVRHSSSTPIPKVGIISLENQFTCVPLL